MGTNLSGNRIKNSYQGLLKTTDNTVLTAASTGFHVISDGSGNDTRLSLATDGTKIDATGNGLTIENLSDTTETKALVVSSSGVVSKRTFPSAQAITVAGANGANGSDFDTDPSVSLSVGGQSGTITFTGGLGINVTRSGTTASPTFTFTRGSESTTNTIFTNTSDFSVAANNAQANRTLFLDMAALTDNGTRTISLPAATTALVGLTFRFVVLRPSTKTNVLKIKGNTSGTADKIFGKAVLMKDNSASRVQIADEASTNFTTVELRSNDVAKGGQAGDEIICRVFAENMWMVTAHLTTTGSITTPAIFTT